jgi:hypothetical protein
MHTIPNQAPTKRALYGSGRGVARCRIRSGAERPFVIVIRALALARLVAWAMLSPR